MILYITFAFAIRALREGTSVQFRLRIWAVGPRKCRRGPMRALVSNLRCSCAFSFELTDGQTMLITSSGELAKIRQSV